MGGITVKAKASLINYLGPSGVYLFLPNDLGDDISNFTSVSLTLSLSPSLSLSLTLCLSVSLSLSDYLSLSFCLSSSLR